MRAAAFVPHAPIEQTPHLRPQIAPLVQLHAAEVSAAAAPPPPPRLRRRHRSRLCRRRRRRSKIAVKFAAHSDTL